MQASKKFETHGADRLLLLGKHGSRHPGHFRVVQSAGAYRQRTPQWRAHSRVWIKRSSLGEKFPTSCCKTSMVVLKLIDITIAINCNNCYLKSIWMTIDGPLNFLLPEDLASQMGKRAQARRLAANLSRKTLSLRSGVPVSTLRKFESSGKIGLLALLQLAETLDCLDEFGQMFPPRVLTSIEDFVAPVRQRGSQ